MFGEWKLTECKYGYTEKVPCCQCRGQKHDKHIIAGYSDILAWRANLKYVK
jgi:hypothetical protein